MDADKLSLPSEWQVKAIQDVYKFTKKPSSLKLDDYKKIPFIPMELVPLGRIFAEDWNWKNREDLGSGTYFENGDLLVAKITPSFENGKQAIVKIDNPFGYATTEVIPIQGIEGVSDKFYLHFVLLHPEIRRELAGKMDGSTGRQRLRKETLASKRIPFPPLDEQRRIANILTTVQTAIEQQAKLIDLTRELKSALMKKLFTEGLRGEKQKETEIGLIPESWDVLQVEKLARASFQNGAFIKKPILGKGILFANVVDMYRDVYVDYEKLERIEVDLSKIRRYLLEENDLLVVRSSLKREGVGQNSIAKNIAEPVFYDCHIIRVKPDTNLIVPEFLSYFWRSDKGKQDLIQRSKTTTMTTINQKTLAGALIPVPPYDEQTKIVNILLTIDKKVQVNNKKKEKLEELFRALLHQLMTGEIRTKDITGLEDL